jgi:hypothetical protein
MVAGEGPNWGEIVISAKGFAPAFYAPLVRSMKLASSAEGRDHDSQTTKEAPH